MEISQSKPQKQCANCFLYRVYPQEFTINGNQTFYQISLAEDTQTLDEVVVVGFGTQKKVNLTGAVATVDKKHWNHVLSLQSHKLFKE